MSAYAPLIYLVRDQSLAECENRRLGAITNTQFLKDNRQVIFYRFLRIDQLLRNLPVAHAGRDIADNFNFFLCEGVNRWPIRRQLRQTPVFADKRTRQVWLDEHTAVMHCSNGLRKLV